jgi:hypothetical protein
VFLWLNKIKFVYQINQFQYYDPGIRAFAAQIDYSKFRFNYFVKGKISSSKLNHFNYQSIGIDVF